MLKDINWVQWNIWYFSGII